ncbi:MmgE/PrpD family protein [Blastococcus brunescens]|uniref:MmgE/PrpD family protein n=1 Tax=Blastococcus brunescens TaxID=1564165 RepID=A0ABZ1B3M9_9ACTN|nr:MmgE/PrpD family protein [Blastococcus sp. BMG 8361]WRL65412.1 MmgE/PrpD family protein [Blastococcus sp. BMG 8361]
MTERFEPTAARSFAEFGATLKLDDIPRDVIGTATLHLLDTLGCGIAAVGTGAAEVARGYGLRAAPGAASGLGVSSGIQGADAALVNGIACHALDFDDTYPPAMMHISTVVVPAALAAAEERRSTGEELLVALIAGGETTSRISRVAGDAFHRRGFHPTSICGVFGATVAVARLNRLTADQTTNALGIAGSMASGLMAYLSDGSSTKQLHPGWAAHSTHIAVQLAQLGATGPTSVLEGRNGLYSAFLGRTDFKSEDIIGDLSDEWHTLELSIKPYSACHFVHAPLDALRELQADHAFGPDQVDRITVFTPKVGAELVANPIERKIRPATPYESKFSVPFVLAAWLQEGVVDTDTFDEPFLSDPGILDVASRVDYEVMQYDTFPASLPGSTRRIVGWWGT